MSHAHSVPKGHITNSLASGNFMPVLPDLVSKPCLDMNFSSISNVVIPNPNFLDLGALTLKINAKECSKPVSLAQSLPCSTVRSDMLVPAGHAARFTIYELRIMVSNHEWSS